MDIVEINDLNALKTKKETVLVLGYFDGIHLGHKALFDKARKLADEHGLTVSVLTFPESPKLAFARFTPELLLHLSTPEKRFSLMERYGVDTLYLTDFTSSFAKQSPQEFVDRYIAGLQAKILVTGFDYHFGNSRADVSDLKRLFPGPVEVIEEVRLHDEKVSSTRIRKAIARGDVATANQLLGYTFSTEGIVVHGDARGRTIGYPTANLAPVERVHLPSDGVYVADVEVEGERYRAMASVGKNVTFDGTELRLEAHIFGFEKEIYGQKMTIYWLDKIRDMVKFDGIDSLMQQMKSDESISLKWTEG
ncbi:bifunctional riboflavin kinase/FAD synthetase [Streptococcus cameli]